MELKNCYVYFIENNNLFLLKEKKNFIFLFNEIKFDVFYVNCCWLLMLVYIVMWVRNVGYYVVYILYGMFELWIMKCYYWIKKFFVLLLF